MRGSVFIFFVTFAFTGTVFVQAQQPPPRTTTPPIAPAPAQSPNFNPALANVVNPSEDLASARAMGLSRRDPFKLPEYLIIKLRQKMASSPTGIDESVEAIRRWPLVTYQLVGIIWDVKRPKAMFMDRMNNIHMLQVNEFIGNAKGVIVSIQSGSVTVLEGKIPQIIKLKK